MRWKQVVIGVLASLLALVAPAIAQKNELSGIVGRTFIGNQVIQGSNTFDNKLRFGNGLTFEVNYARHLMGRGFFSLAVEVPFVVNPDEDLHAALPNRVPEQFASYFVTPSARVRMFSGQGVSPWVSVGGGIGRFAESSNLLFGGSNTGTTGNTTGVFQIGVGLDVRLFGSFSLRAEGRDFWSGVPKMTVTTDQSRQHNLFAGAGIVWHF